MQENAKRDGVFYKTLATILLIIPWIAYLWITTYDKAQPTLFGITFFYWYQTAWLVISSILYAIAAYLIYRGEKQ